MVVTDMDSAADTATLHATLVERARALTPRIRERAAHTEALRAVPHESIDEIVAAGLGGRILAPRRFGGDELSLDTMYEVSLELGRACASTAWCAALLPHDAHMVGFFPQAAQEAVWMDGPDACIAASLAPAATVQKVDGGYRLTGRHGFASGVDHASWVIVSGLIKDGVRPANHHFLVKPGDYTVDDDWFAAGMRGTGSKTIVIDDVFVPEGFVLAAAALVAGDGPGREVNHGPLYRQPLALHAGLTFLGPMMGTALDAYDYFVEWARGRAQTAGSEIVQEAVAKTAADLELAQLSVRRILAAARTSGSLELADRAAILRDYNRVAEVLTESVDRLFGLSGTSGFKETSPMQQKWRDIHMMASHVSFTRANFQHYGRMVLGLERDPKLVVF
ncbi:acyl-CoA dehydrogenase family protein [Rhodococcus oxybenzonivorans]|uniref:acyl-CoA dehydrogenase family protein n=1 Tax=Rhodococcus oxybenzonivorans TaxID=1990687 RepID=UPI002953C394|nr:acyl-CoA dehydrogenase family protein [Rhodococcus oxybenzonivorans]MDV7352113.1 acyl-CoA dehydrogenase family protein [Rhodococcus oxybenzonivorans]